MQWNKKGLVFAPDYRTPWAVHSALQPTPLVRATTIRVFVGMRDALGVSRVGYVDVKKDDPTCVVQVSHKPALEIGRPGTFDENGVVPCAIVERGEKLFLYYAGYQPGTRVRFCVFGGLATSDDGGETFTRHSEVPILDRTDGELFFRVIHSIRHENGVWRAWYGGGSTWVTEDNRSLAVYDVRYFESPDGISFPREGRVCIPVAGGDEHRLGRPYVTKEAKRYRMYYGIGTKSQGYRLGCADSVDGLVWQRRDGEVGISVSKSGWDAQMIAYPAVVQCGERTFLFYNGNQMGKTGFGVAER